MTEVFYHKTTGKNKLKLSEPAFYFKMERDPGLSLRCAGALPGRKNG
jgi:hypothetical protein